MATATHSPVEGKCNAVKQGGAALCGHPAGWGTGHVGSGYCRKHGGSTRNGEKHGAKLASLQFARGALGAEVATNETEALAQSIRLAAGITDYWRHKIADAASEGKPLDGFLDQYREAVKLQGQMAKAGADAGIAERRQALTERVASMLGAAFEDAVSEVLGELLTPELRAGVVRAFTSRVAVLESTAEEIDGEDPLALTP